MGQALLSDVQFPSVDKSGTINAHNKRGTLNVPLQQQDFFKSDDLNPPNIDDAYQKGGTGGDEALKKAAKDYRAANKNRNTLSEKIYRTLQTSTQYGNNADWASAFDFNATKKQFESVKKQTCFVQKTQHITGYDRVWMPNYKQCEVLLKPKPCILKRKISTRQHRKTIFKVQRCVNTAFHITFKAFEPVNTSFR